MIGGGSAQRVDEAPNGAVVLDWPVAVLPSASRDTEEAIAPDRYRIQERAGVRLLICSEAPGVAVRMQRGTTVAATAARRAPHGSIFLDGAAAGGPFVDPQRAVYNLDHHDGCIRPFTMATCEQAMVLVRRLVDLRRRDWTVYANDADLDTVLAIWVLLNHLRLNADDGRVRAAVMPLVRLESTIDAHGLEHVDLCGLPSDELREAWRWMEELRDRELAIKETGQWGRRDLLEHLADQLRAIDALVYPAGAFEDVLEIEEIARVRMSGDSVSVACRASQGIYEVERQLRRVYGRRLGVIVLQTDPTTYSIRQLDPELPASLDEVYQHLNLLDPAASGSGSTNRWGGSSEIGGSPRSTGTRLTAGQIVEVCRHACSERTVLADMLCIGSSLGLPVGIVLVALLAASAPLLPSASFDSAASVAAVLSLCACASLLFSASRAPGLLGLRLTGLQSFWRAAPLAVFGALAGGVWIPKDAALSWPALVAGMGMVVSAEVLFRGTAFGKLAWGLRSRYARMSGLASLPVWMTAIVYAPTVLLAPVMLGPIAPVLPELPSYGVAGMGGLCFGVASGWARERSGSLLPSIGLHAVGVLAAILVGLLL
jgi:membrane protease YdiL (CAAX protease family)